MVICQKCKKEISIWKSYPQKGGYSLCKDCREDVRDNPAILDKLRTEPSLKLSKKVSEIKCECNQCNNIWHYLPSEEKSLKRQSFFNSLIGAGSLGSHVGAFFSNKSNDLQREADKFKKCPKCGSIDITKKEVAHVIQG